MVSEDDGRVYFTFPAADVLANSEDSDMNSCRLGYRAPYLYDTARKVADDPEWAERIHSLGTDDARKELMRFKGVGKKVADCVLLFAFERYDAIPVDVWIRRIMVQYYPELGKPGTYDQIRDEAKRRFGIYAGYAQEYLFCMREDLAGNKRTGM
jgi:N-glycosylase/DNA lyase